MNSNSREREQLPLPLPDITLPDDLLPDVTLPDILLPDVILFDDLPWSEPEEETGDSTARAIVETMSREERERAIGVSPDIRRWFDSLLSLPTVEREKAVQRMAGCDREKFNRWREIAAA